MIGAGPDLTGNIVQLARLQRAPELDRPKQ